MRSVRMLLATATATAALAIAPAAHAVTMGDWDSDDGSHAKSEGHDPSYSKEHEEERHHDGPRGGIHTGGGALASVTNGDDWAGDGNPKHDPDSYRGKEDGPQKSWGDDRERDHGGDSWQGDQEDSWGGDHDEESWRSGHGKPRGGMHTGGGGLASSGGVTAGGLAVLAVAGTGMYVVRRKRTATTPA